MPLFSSAISSRRTAGVDVQDTPSADSASKTSRAASPLDE
jgi:hypothetical protein